MAMNPICEEDCTAVDPLAAHRRLCQRKKGAPMGIDGRSVNQDMNGGDGRGRVRTVV